MFTRPRGTRDFLPEETEERRRVESILRKAFEQFGYREVQTPLFERLEVFTEKSGEEIKEHLYDFEDKSKRKLALRPELSAPTIRLYVNELRTKPKPRKLYYFENCFRYERPQKGRYREFWQAGVELIGSDRPEAEAEVIALSIYCIERLELKKYKLSIGHLGILRALLAKHGIQEDTQNNIISLLDKGDKKGLESLSIPVQAKNDMLNIVELHGSRTDVLKKAENIFGTQVPDELLKFRKFLELLEQFGINEYSLDLGIARGLDYYTGMVFEIRSEGLGAQDQICGGGTYSLVKILGGGDTPSCGFAFGFDRLLLALEPHREKSKNEVPKVFVVPSSRKMLNRAIKITKILRESVSCDIELMGRKLDKSLSYANSEGIPYVLIVSEDLGSNKVILRNMETGDQIERDVKGVIDAIE
jgi:histidyl-tRNA synthetase